MKKTWYLLLLLFPLSCGDDSKAIVEEQDNKKAAVTKPDVQHYEFDVDLKNELAFSYMNEEEEPRGLYEEDIKRKATCSMVQVYEFDPADMLRVQTKNRCKAWISNDTLYIRLSAPYAGVGVKLQVINGNYRSQPYTNFAPDLVMNHEDEEPSQTELQKGKLVLDKMSYDIGDSLYGHLYLRSLIDGTAKHYAQGFFRAKIEVRK